MADQRGPNIKITPRKQSKPGFVCPTCKEKFSTQEEFKDHVVECATKRYECDICDSTFMKLAYKNQHMKRYHKQERTQEKEICSEKEQSHTEKDSRKIDDSDSEDSDWDRESAEVFLGDEESEQDSDSGLVKLENTKNETDKRNVNNIREGRMIRKRTNPNPVIAPVKKSVKSAIAQISERKVSDRMKESSGEEPQVPAICSSDLTRKSEKINCPASVRKENQKQTLELQFSVDQGCDKKSRQSFNLSVDKEEVVSSSIMIQANRGLGVMDFNLGNFVSAQSVKPENIKIKVDNGKLIMTMIAEQ
ncbi:MAG: hypothetical protein AB2693_28910 [Candidatus Thiodiazotropha sp.]